MALVSERDENGDFVWRYVPDTDTSWSPSQSDINLFADLGGFTPTEASNWLKNIEKTYDEEGPGVAGSAGGSWATPTATWLNIAKQLIPSDTAGQFKLASGLMGAIGGALTGSATPQRVGYQGSIPQYTAVRQAVPGTYDPKRRPGSGGQQYFTDVQYVPKSDAPAIEAAQNVAQQQAQQMAVANAANPAKQTVKMAGGGLLDYFTHGGLDLNQYRQLLGDSTGASASPYSASSTTTSAAPTDNTMQILQALARVQGNTPAATAQGTTPAQTQDTTPQGTTPALIPPEKPKLEEPVAIPEQLSQEAYDLIHPEYEAADTMQWYQNEDGTYGLGGGVSGSWLDRSMYEYETPQRFFQGYKNVPLEALNNYAKAQSDFYKRGQATNDWSQEEYDKVQNMLDQYSVWKNYTPPEKPQFIEPVADSKPTEAAHGGLMALARGRYLQGTTDGMADKLPASIDGRQPAKLSHGEFVVPADVVSHLGNGNSDAGAKKLYSMMDKIRMARTGTKKQGKQINPDKYMPGGSVGYAEGGGIKGYAGETGSLVSGTKPTTYESNLSTWAGPYVTEMLGRGQAAATMPYQAYQGPLTAGASGLQQQAFTGYGNLQTPAGVGQAATTAGDITKQMQGMTGAGTFATDTFGTQQAQQYMNPYLQAALDPQIAEARRQAQISNLQNMSKLTQAGAYGGGRQAILQAEADRNLQQNLANITGQGYNTAYQQAMAQFNADQARKQQAQQFGAQYGLQALQGALGGAQAQGSLAAQQNQLGLANLGAQMQAGAAQRGIESEGVAADIKQFEEARDYPLKMAQYMASLLPNLPLATQGSQTTTTNTAQNAAGGAASTIALLQKLGLIKADATTTT